MAAPPPPGPPLSTKGGLIGLVFALLVLSGVGAAIAIPEMNRDDHKGDYHDDHGDEHHDDEHGDDHDDHDHDEDHGDDHDGDA